MELTELKEKLVSLNNSSNISIDEFISLRNTYNSLPSDKEVNELLNIIKDKINNRLNLELLYIADHPSYKAINDFENKVKDYDFYEPVYETFILKDELTMKLNDLKDKSKKALSYRLIREVGEEVAKYKLEDTEDIRKTLEENTNLLDFKFRELKELEIVNRKLCFLLKMDYSEPIYFKDDLTLENLESYINYEYTRKTLLNSMLDAKLNNLLSSALLGLATTAAGYAMIKKLTNNK